MASAIKKNVIYLYVSISVLYATCTFHAPYNDLSHFVHVFVRVSVIFGTFSSTAAFKKTMHESARIQHDLYYFGSGSHSRTYNFYDSRAHCDGLVVSLDRLEVEEPNPEKHKMNRRKFNYARYFAGNECSHFHRMQRLQSVRIHPFFIPNKVICTGTK